MWVKWGVGMLLLLLALWGRSQYSELEIIQKIKSFQVEEDTFYDAGLFPAHRSWSFSKKPVEDNTIFFTAAIAALLQTHETRMSDEAKALSKKIVSDVQPLFEKYKNRNGEVTFNFWQTVPPDLPFPNGHSFLSNRRTRLPDDYNTTMLILLSQEQNDSTDHLVRQKMSEYSSRKLRDKVKLITPKAYEASKAYEVWFGKDMPQTFDICVMSNIMCYVLRRNFELNRYDSATIDLMHQMILSKDYRYRIEDISHHTSSEAVVLYHVTKALALDNQEVFAPIRQPVINALQQLSAKEQNEVAKTLVLSSLYRLGQHVDTSIDFMKFEKDLVQFESFTVNPSGISAGPSKLLPSFRWQCEAYYWALGLEYMLLKNTFVDHE